jgi:hypothetical protein
MRTSLLLLALASAVGTASPSVAAEGAGAPGPGAPASSAEPPASPSASAAEPASAEALPPHEAAGPTDASGGTDWPLVGGLVSWAAGMGFVIVFNYAFFRLNDTVTNDSMKAYRQGVPAGESSCERARAGAVVSTAGAPSPSEIADLCDEADSMEVLRNVTLPLGLALGILGVVLVGTSDTVNGPSDTEGEARGWRVRGGVGPSGGAASLAISF